MSVSTKMCKKSENLSYAEVVCFVAQTGEISGFQLITNILLSFRNEVYVTFTHQGTVGSSQEMIKEGWNM